MEEPRPTAIARINPRGRRLPDSDAGTPQPGKPRNAIVARPRLPDFLGVGPPRAATSWLDMVLRGHVGLPRDVKEVDFFARNYSRGIDWYKNYFSECDPALPAGEICPSYFGSTEARRRIAEDLPDCKIICTFRKPADMLYSFYKLARRNVWPGVNDFASFVPENWWRDLAERLKEWQTLFGRHNVLVCIYDDLEADPQAYLDGICDFIGIARIAIGHSALVRQRINTFTHQPKNRRLARRARILRDALKRREAYATLNLLARAGFWRYCFERGEEYPELSPEVEASLCARLRPEVAALEELIGRDLSAWKRPHTRSPIHTALRHAQPDRKVGRGPGVDLPVRAATRRNHSKKRTSRVAGVAIACWLAAVLALHFGQKQHDRLSYRVDSSFPPGERFAPGEIYATTLAAIMDHELHSGFGWRPNDFFLWGPKVLADNNANRQLAIVAAVRDAMRVFKNDRAGQHDPNLLRADSDFRTESTNWILPSAESRYDDGIKHLQMYVIGLHATPPTSSELDERKGELIRLLQSGSEMLSHAHATLYQKRDADGGPIYPWNDDDCFYRSQGYSHVMYYMLQAAIREYVPTQKRTPDLIRLMQQTLDPLQNAATIKPLIIFAGGPASGKGCWEELDGYVAAALQKLSTIRKAMNPDG